MFYPRFKKKSIIITVSENCYVPVLNDFFTVPLEVCIFFFPGCSSSIFNVLWHESCPLTYRPKRVWKPGSTQPSLSWAIYQKNVQRDLESPQPFFCQWFLSLVNSRAATHDYFDSQVICQLWKRLIDQLDYESHNYSLALNELCDLILPWGMC